MLAAFALFLVWVSALMLPERSPVARGAEFANRQGCIRCHGQPDTQYPDDSSINCSPRRVRGSHVRYDGRCEDLLAYFEVVRLKRDFDVRLRASDQNRLLRGEALAREYNCFLCHGELGQGGFRNAGALKGYIPGYFGNDFKSLTRGARIESVTAWITQGVDPKLVAIPFKGRIAKYFIEHQDVSMPMFYTLAESEIELLSEYVIALHRFGPMSAQSIREYGQATQRAEIAAQETGSVPTNLPRTHFSIRSTEQHATN